MEQAAQIPEKLMKLAQREAERRNCSIREQIAHWMMIGRAIECTDEFDFSIIEATLDGTRDPRELHEGEHAVWAEAFVSLMSAPARTEALFLAGRRRLGLGVGIGVAGNLVHARPKDD